jgi:hypothetical protein
VSGRDGAMLLAGGPMKNRNRFTLCTHCREPGAAATLLYLMGLPIADDLSTWPVTDIVDPDFLERHPIRQIPNYDAATTRRSVRTGQQPLDAEALERLRSLGYIR